MYFYFLALSLLQDSGRSPIPKTCCFTSRSTYYRINKNPSRLVERMESDIPETDKFQQTELLRQTIKLWTLLIHQDTNPLRQDVNLASDDPTERLISELSRRFPENNHDGSFIDEHEPLPKDTAVEKEDDPKTVCWMKNRVALQDEFVRFAIWKSNFSARDIALLVSDASPLFRSIVETVLSIAETLLECKIAASLSIGVP